MAWGAERPVPVSSTDTVQAILFRGNVAVDSITLEKRLSLKADGPYAPLQVKFSHDVIESIYRDKGYADVRVSSETTRPAAHRYIVLFRIDEGPLYHVHAITIEGNHAIAQRLILRDLGVKPGDPLSANPKFTRATSNSSSPVILRRRTFITRRRRRMGLTSRST